MNASGGTDHGHGSVMWLLGGGLSRQRRARASGRADRRRRSTTATCPGVNNPFDVLGELVQKRLGVGSLSTVFPGHSYEPLGVATTV